MNDYDQLIDKYANQFGVDPAIAHRMAMKESAGNPTAVSKKGAVGLFQLMPDTAKELGVTDANDPEQNTRAAMQHMSNLLKKNNGDYNLALASYNAGQGAVDQHKGIPPFPETQDYVKKIMQKPSINWDEVGKEEQPAATPQQAVSKINWDQVPTTHDTIGPREGGVGTWLEDAMHDIREGTDTTLPGKILKTMGAPGTHKGTSGMTGEILGGPVVGPFEATHGATKLIDPDSNTSQRIKGANEIFSGVGKTVGPFLGASNPATLPTIASFAPAGSLVQHGAEALGADPDTAELAANIGMVAAPGIKKFVAPPAGRFLQKYSGPLGTAATVGAGAIKAVKTGNPEWLVSSLAKKPVSATINSVGRGVEALGEKPLFPHEIIKNPTFQPDYKPQPAGLIKGAPIEAPTATVETGKPQPPPVDATSRAQRKGLILGEGTKPVEAPSSSLVETGETKSAPPVDATTRAQRKGLILTEGQKPPIEMPAAPETTESALKPAIAQITRGQGGRMTKQFLTGTAEPGAKPIPAGKAEPAFQPRPGVPQTPPPVQDKFRTETTGNKPLVESFQSDSEDEQISQLKPHGVSKEAWDWAVDSQHQALDGESRLDAAKLLLSDTRPEEISFMHQNRNLENTSKPLIDTVPGNEGGRSGADAAALKAAHPEWFKAEKPLEMVGNKPLVDTRKKSSFSLGPKEDDSEGDFTHPILKNGKRIGVIELSRGKDPKSAVINWIGTAEDEEDDFLDIGPSGMREILKSLQKSHPEIERFEGWRVGGAGPGRAISFDNKEAKD